MRREILPTGEQVDAVDDVVKLIHPSKMTGVQRRFQNRARRVKDDGDDFEDFVFECFRVAREERGFSKRLARGRDGAIDLIDRFEEAGAATIAECKYIGSGSAGDATARWREVYRNLDNNLPGLGSDPAKIARSAYGAWVDPKRPIARYRFCVTAAMNEREIAALEARIAGDFAKLVGAGIEPLRTLAETPGAVRVFSWDWFAAALDEHPSLAFRWFRGLPPGVELFAGQGDASETFRDFLNSGQLRYFSRDEYAKGGARSVDRGEADLVASLAGEKTALLITGPGGVGKTRLSWELAEELAKPKHGFDVYRLGRSANVASVNDLAARYPAPASILLVVDYAEAAAGLGGVADAIDHLVSNSGHRLRLIATCRASATNQVKDAVGVLSFEEKSLGSVRTGEEEYVRWVAREILSLESMPQRAEIERVCHGVPALAAFAVFLFRRHRQQFDAQFGVLHGLGDFENWANHRIAALAVRFREDPSAGRALARVALALPLNADAFEAIEAESSSNRSLLRALIDDRWIEREEDCYFAAHDVLADALAARWLFEAESAATERAIDLLRDAARHNRLAGALIALDRLALHPRLAEIDGMAVVNDLLTRHPDQTLQCCGTLLAGALLSFEAKLALLHHSEAMRETLGHPIYDVGLSLLAAEAARRKLRVEEEPALATLIDLLDRANEHAHNSNMVLRRAYALDPQRFRLRALANLAAFPVAEPTHFLLAQMLRSGEPPESLAAAVQLWLDSNADALRAGFVYAAWLNAKGPTAAVLAPLLDWVRAHGHTHDAIFVYSAWLHAKGSLDAISGPLLAWIDAYGHEAEARYLYSGWLVAKAPIEAISDPLRAWLSVHGQEPEARFIYSNWLAAKAPVEMISTPLLTWLDLHGQSFGASFVYAAWLDAENPIGAVSAPLLAWVETHAQTRDAQFLYAAWLSAGGGIEKISAPLLAWLEVYGQEPEARFVYSGWLGANGARDAVSAPLFAWLDAHGQMPEASFVYAAWLDAEGSIDAVSVPLFAWIEVHGLTLDARYVYAAWLAAAGAIEAVSAALLAWIELNSCAFEADFVYRAWLEADGPFEAIKTPACHWVLQWRDTPKFVYLSKALSKRSDLPEPIILAIAEWCATFAESEDALNRMQRLITNLTMQSLTIEGERELLRRLGQVLKGRIGQDLSDSQRQELCRFFDVVALRSAPMGVVRCFAEVVLDGRVFNGIFKDAVRAQDWSVRGVAYLVLQALRCGALDVDRDFDALLQFKHWLIAVAPIEARSMLARLNAMFPNRLWDR